MILKHRVALDGVQLDGIDWRIMIRRVETGDAKNVLSTTSLPEDGMRVTAMSRDSIDVTVRFNIRARKTEMAAREEVLEKVNAWARSGGILTAGYKPDRKIAVFLAQAAGAGDPWEWTRDYTLVFRACGVPYWQQENPTTVVRQNVSSGNIPIAVDGSAVGVIEAAFRNTSGGTVDTFSISTGESSMSFTGLGLLSGETLEIDHNDTGKKCIQRLRIRSTGGVYRSVLDKRSGSDDLDITPGDRVITFSAGGAGTITVKSCGRFA